jgi:hypothetical protein
VRIPLMVEVEEYDLMRVQINSWHNC